MAAGLNLRDALAGLARIAPAIAAGRLPASAAAAPAYVALRGPAPRTPAPAPGDVADAARYYLGELQAIAAADLSGLSPRNAVAAVRSMARSALGNAPAPVRALAEATPELASVHGAIERLGTRLIPHHRFGQSEAAEIAAKSGRRLVEAGLAPAASAPAGVPDPATAVRDEAEALESLAARVGEAARSGASLAALAAEAAGAVRGQGHALRALRDARLDEILEADPDGAADIIRDRARASSAAGALTHFARLHEARGDGCRPDAARSMAHALETADHIRSSRHADIYTPQRR